MATPTKTTKIGKYDVVGVIGRGGMGVVYQAKDPYLDRLVAIKMMNVDAHESADFLDRFYREAKATASLQHPNIVAVYELGEHLGRPFLVMQYIEGHSLEALIRAHRPMTLLEKLSIIIEVCQGLSYAHLHGIVHRDIKPGNIMILNDGGVKIVDFGIARLGDHTVTRTGQIVGSLHYMPPEQIRGQTVDMRSDIYATGIVLYQLLTYSLPFEGESTVATLAKIISDDPPPFEQFGVSCPPELEAITLKALAKNRDDRFPSAEAFAVSLGEIQGKLKQEAIEAYLNKAELLQQSNELPQAEDYLLRVLKLDRQNTSAAKLLSAIRVKLQAQLSAERVQQLKQQAVEAFGREDYDVAIAFVSQAIQLDHGPELQALRADVEKAKADAEVIRKAVARAEAAQRSGDLDTAKNAIEMANARRPNDSRIKALRRAIERDLEERERQRNVESLLDEARKQMAARKFTAALDLLREAQKLDPSAPQLRTLLERLTSEHQYEKQRRELDRLNREVQDAIDRDDYKTASAKAADALSKFPNESALARLKELADAQIEVATQKEFVRKQVTSAQQFLDAGQVLKALEVVESALTRVPANTRLESLRNMLHERLARDRDEADKATCVRQANEAIGLARYADAIRLLEGARLRFADSSEIDELLRFAGDQQAKVQRQAAIDQAMRRAQELLAKQHFEEAVETLEKAVQQQRSEDLDLLLRQAKDQREDFRRDLQAAIAKGRSLLDKVEIANAREFLGSRPVAYQQSSEFCDLLAQAQAAALPKPEVADPSAEATRMFSTSEKTHESSTLVQQETAFYPEVISGPAPPVEEPPDVATRKVQFPRRRNPLFLGAAVLAVVLAALGIWWIVTPRKPHDAYLEIRGTPQAEVRVDGNVLGVIPSNGPLSIKVVPGAHEVRATLDGHESEVSRVNVKAGEHSSVDAYVIVPPPPPPRPTPSGDLLVRSNVDGAEVLVDGKLKGLTGHDKRYKTTLDEGSHRVQLKKSGYDDSTEQLIEISANKERQASFTLNKAAGLPTQSPTDAYLDIQSRPGATVQVDGKQQESIGPDGSRMVKVSPGYHQIQVNLEGFDSWSGSVTVKAGDQLKVRAPLFAAKVVQPPPPAPTPPTADLTASQKTIEEGQTVTLNWTTQHATEVSIDQGIGSVTATDTRAVSPNKTTTYTLTAKGGGGSATAKLEVTVRPKQAETPAVIPTPVTPPAATTGDADVPGIIAARKKFQNAFEAIDPENELKAAWPSIPPKVSGSLLQGIKNKTVQHMQVREDCPGSPKISGDVASWSCTETVVYLEGLKQKPQKPNAVLFGFKKDPSGKWIVDSRGGGK